MRGDAHFLNLFAFCAGSAPVVRVFAISARLVRVRVDSAAKGMEVLGWTAKNCFGRGVIEDCA